MLHNLLDNLKVKNNVNPAAIAASTNGTIVDMQGYKHALFLIQVGTFAFDGTNKWTLSIEHGDAANLSDAAAPADADTLNVATSGVIHVLDAGTEDESLFVVPYIGNKRYVRVVITEGGVVSCVAGVIALLMPDHMPVSNANPIAVG